MSWLAATWSVFHFEWRRTTTLSRVSIWLGLVAFPAVIVALMRFVANAPRDASQSIAWDIVLASLTGMVCLLALLFWATPIVSEERSSNTWSYLAVRSCGVAAIVIGKYLNAVAWAVVTAMTAMTLAVLIGQPPGGWSLWLVLTGLTLLAAPAYGAVFAFFGVAFDRIAMALALVYALIFEVVVASVPAVINQLTIRYRLQTLLYHWRGWDIGRMRRLFVAEDEPQWQQIAIMVGAAVVLVGLSVFITSCRELTKPEKG